MFMHALNFRGSPSITLSDDRESRSAILGHSAGLENEDYDNNDDEPLDLPDYEVFLMGMGGMEIEDSTSPRSPSISPSLSVGSLVTPSPGTHDSSSFQVGSPPSPRYTSSLFR